MNLPGKNPITENNMRIQLSKKTHIYHVESKIKTPCDIKKLHCGLIKIVAKPFTYDFTKNEKIFAGWKFQTWVVKRIL